MTITRDSGTQITFDATNTWVANSATAAGYVAASGASCKIVKFGKQMLMVIQVGETDATGE